MATAADGQRAHDILLSFEPLAMRGACWHYVWKAYAAAGASTGMGSTPTALRGWQVSLGKHPGDRNPPPGAAIWLGRRLSDGNMDGDVFIAGQADGDHAATDQPSWNQTGVTSIQGRMNLTGREYLGWTDHVCDAPIITGGQPTQGNQRKVGANPANQRQAPTTTSPSVSQLAPGTVGTFDGWKTGEAVEGNSVWFRGQFSGLFSWSGGFTDTGTHDLQDLNVSLGPTQRQAVPAGANGRAEPQTGSPVVTTLAGGAIGNFDGWKYGDSVEANAIWFHGAESGAWFWSGGFTDKGTHDLPDMGQVTPPPPDTNRTVVAAGANVRTAPYVDAPPSGHLTGGTVVNVLNYAHSDSVEGNDVWFRHAGGWSWSGGFTSTSTEGITEQAPPVKPPPSDPNNPLGLPTYPPVYPRAVIGLEAPLGFQNCEVGGVRAKRTEKRAADGSTVATSGIIDRLIVHWAYPPGDERRFFSTCNSRGSCPTQYIDAAALALEFIRPGAKPASTGPEWNWRSWAIEVEPLNDGTDPNNPPFTPAQVDEIVEQMVFLREHDGKTLDGAPVEFLLDREHVIGHRDVANVDCPGDFLYDLLDEMIVEAQRRYDERNGTTPPPPDTHLDPAKYPALWALRNELNDAFGP